MESVRKQRGRDTEIDRDRCAERDNKRNTELETEIDVLREITRETERQTAAEKMQADRKLDTGGGRENEKEVERWRDVRMREGGGRR